MMIKAPPPFTAVLPSSKELEDLRWGFILSSVNFSETWGMKLYILICEKKPSVSNHYKKFKKEKKLSSEKFFTNSAIKFLFTSKWKSFLKEIFLSWLSAFFKKKEVKWRQENYQQIFLFSRWTKNSIKI